MKRPSNTRIALYAAAALIAAGAAWAAYAFRPPKTAGPVKVTAQPQPVWIEAGDSAQSLNFDFLVENQGAHPLGIDSIEVTVTDASGATVQRRFIDSNGFAPSIETVPGRIVAAGQKILIFNPFHSFRPDMELHRLEYRFSLSIPNEAPEAQATTVIEPRVYTSKTQLALPLKGRILVHDGHDFYAHHRRLNTEHPAAKDFGLTRNFMRYSLDLNVAGDRFEPYKGSGGVNEDWHAWGQPVYAPGDGTVADANDAEPDNVRGGRNYFDPGKLKSTPMKFYGNYVVIDHGNGEFSLLGHLQKGSLSVKAGDKVTRGQPVAKIGSSGSSHNPHLHYELRTGKDLQVEGLPATFRGFTRHLGAKTVSVDAGSVDTGDLLEAR